MLMFFSSIASGLSFGKRAGIVMTKLCFFRFWLGSGIGGDPLSATVMSEYDNKRTRGAFIVAVFAMQGFGILTAGLASLFVSSAFNHIFAAPAFDVNGPASTVPETDFVWRIILMSGAFPATLTYYWRMKVPETSRYTAFVAKNMEQAAADMSKVLQVDLQVKVDEAAAANTAQNNENSYGLFSKKFLQRYPLHLVGTTTSWFFLDVAFYSQNLFQKDIFTAIGWLPKPTKMNAIYEVFEIARTQTIIALCGTIPGYWFTVAFIDKMGRFQIQLTGFFFMTLSMYAVAIPYDYWKNSDVRCFVIMYALTFFFANFGPNSTTFVVPAEIFPTGLRSTCHGISAAAGKAGAIVDGFGFLYASQDPNPLLRDDQQYSAGLGMKHTLVLLASVTSLRMFFTLLVPEAKGKSLETLSDENGAENGEMEMHSSKQSYYLYYS